MALDFPKGSEQPPKSIFAHSDETETGLGRERIGQSTIVMSLDGSGDTDNLQDALNLLPPEGGEVFIKEGTYLITKLIEITKNNISIRGVGFGTIFKLEDSTPIDLTWLFLNGPDNIILSNFQVNGNRSGNLETREMTAIELAFCRNCIIENIKFTNIRSNWIIKIRSTDENFGRNIVRSCILNDSEFSSTGIDLQDFNCIIANNVVDGIGGIGIFVRFFDKNIITGNTISNSGDNGIEINQSDDNIIIGNISSGNGRAGIETFTADNNTITGNICKSNTNYGIRIGNAASDKNIITGNICLGNGTTNIADTGTNTHPNGASGTNSLALDDLNIIA